MHPSMVDRQLHRPVHADMYSFEVGTEEHDSPSLNDDDGTMRHKFLNKRLKEAESKVDHCKQLGLDKNILKFEIYSFFLHRK